MDNGASSYRRFLNGDDSGLEDIIKDYKDGLALYLCSIVGNFELAEDAMEETFVRLAIKKPRYNQKSSFKTWLYAIGRHAAMDFIRKRYRHETVPIEVCYDLTDDEQSLDKMMMLEEQKIILHQTIKKLKPEYQQVIWLTYFENFSNKETAFIMKKTVHGIETLLYRARIALKSELEKEGFAYERLS